MFTPDITTLTSTRLASNAFKNGRFLDSTKLKSLENDKLTAKKDLSRYGSKNAGVSLQCFQTHSVQPYVFMC